MIQSERRERERERERERKMNLITFDDIFGRQFSVSCFVHTNSKIELHMQLNEKSI